MQRGAFDMQHDAPRQACGEAGRCNSTRKTALICKQACGKE